MGIPGSLDLAPIPSILANSEAGDRFFTLEYFQKPWRRYVRTPRDLFREVFKYITNEGNKIASKYAKILWLLYEADVHAENAAYVLHRSGGIEKMAREGIFKPVHVDPRDVGDGMDAYGNPIHYPDEEFASAKDQEEEDESPVEVPSTDLLFDYVDSAPTPSGTVKITARYGPGVRGRVVQLLHIEPAPPAPDTAPPPAAILPVEMSRRMRERLDQKGCAVWWVRVERQVTEACSEKFVATKMVKPEEAQAAKAKRARARRVYALRETGQPSTSERRVAVEGMERLPDGTFRSVVSLGRTTRTLAGASAGSGQAQALGSLDHSRAVPGVEMSATL